MRPSLLLVTCAFSLSACAPRALYFHESTKVAFAADYTTSDSQPLSTSFGYKRRIIAVVPAQERIIPDGGSERNATNGGEALSLVSKFHVRASSSEGVVITNNFASGIAARLMTRSAASPEAVSVLMHSAPIAVNPETGNTASGKPGSQAVSDRLAANLAKIRRSNVPPPSGGLQRGKNGKLERTPDNAAGTSRDVPPPIGSLKRDANGKLIHEGTPAKPDAGKDGVPHPSGALERDAKGNLIHKSGLPEK